MNETSKRDSIKEEIATQREFLRGFIIIIIALLTGMSTIITGVISQDKPLYMLFLVAVGFIGVALFSKFTKARYLYIQKLRKELENVGN
jgi:preprotein translocase subunit SecE